MSWSSLLTWASESDDRVERYFLELKSDIDLNEKSGRHKVAKFVLGAANRDPARAAKRFEGHAVMLLGVSVGEIPGIDGFEAKDLAREVHKFVGVPGPDWDFERIRLDSGRDAIAVVVAPPTGRVWPCLADGIGLVDGDIYLRGDGETSKAKGLEIQAMLNRTTSTRKLPAVDVEVLGKIYAIRADAALLVDWVSRREAEYKAQLSGGAGTLMPSIFDGFDRRSEKEFRDQVQTWVNASLADPTAGLHELAAQLFDGISLRVINRTKTFLGDVQVDLTLKPGPVALEWLEQGKSVEIFTDQPSNWGAESIAMLLRRNDWAAGVTFPSTHGQLQIEVSEPVQLSLSLKALRPDQTFDASSEDVVLVSFGEDEPPEFITATWRLTAGEVDDLLENDVKIPVEVVDWRDTLANFLKSADD